MAAFVIVGIVLAGAVLAGCAETVPAPNTTGPSGALYGRVTTSEGEPATDADVRMFQMTRDDKVRTGVAILSAGLFCLVTSVPRRSTPRSRPKVPTASRRG